jgi:hypothetical protein
MNPNYAIVVKQNIDKLLAISFIEPMEWATWLSLIVVVPKKNGKLCICNDFQKLNIATKKESHPLPFMDEVLDKVVNHEVYLFLDGFFGYHEIQITPKDHYKMAFITN